MAKYVINLLLEKMLFRRLLLLSFLFFLINIPNSFGQATQCVSPIVYFLNTEGVSADVVNDGKIKLYGDITGTNKIVVSTTPLAAPTNNTEFTNATLFSSFTNGYIKENAPNTTQTYYVRVYAPDGSCYTDKSINFEKTNFTTTPTQADIMLVVSHNGGTFVTKNTAFNAFVVVQNEGTATATGLEVTVTIPAGITIGTPTVSTGTYNAGTGKWTIPSLAAGSTTTLTFTNTTSTTEGVKFISANLTAEVETDKDSSPTSNNLGEDDQSTACVSTPYELCVGNKIDITLASYSGIVWRKDGIIITGNVSGQYSVNSDGSLTIYSIGEYSYTLTTGPNACPTDGCCPIKVIAAPLPILSLTSIPVACFGGNTGSIAASAISGTTPYEFSKDGTTFQSSGAFPSLNAGTYTITVKDVQGCSATATTVITQPSAALSLAAPVVVNVACYGNSTGSITLTASNGTSPYQYQQGTGAFTSNGTFSGLAAGTYNFIAKDENGCTVTTTATVTQPSAALSLASNPVVTDAACYETATGSVSISATGGTNPYQFKNDSGAFQSSGEFNSLDAGTYTFTVQDANGCSITTSVTVSQPLAALVFDSTPTIVNVSCFGGTDGNVTISASGGTNPYQYKNGNEAFGSSNVFAGLTAGTYTFTVKDAKGCETTTTATVSQPAAALNVTIPAVTAICEGQSATFTSTATGGTSPYTYTWSNSLPDGVTQIVTPSTTTTYTVTATDSKSCQATATVIVTVNPLPTVTLPSLAPCAGVTTVLAPTGLSNAATFMWNTGATTSSISVNSAVPTGYTLTVTSSSSPTCSISKTVWLDVKPLPTAEVTPIPSLCLGSVSQNNGKLMLNKYHDSDQVAYGSPISGSPIFANVPAGGIFTTDLPNTATTYTIRLKNSVTNCTNDITAIMPVVNCPCPVGYCEPATIVKTK